MELDTIWARARRKADERLSICQSCEHYEEKTTRCMKCGCYMPGKVMLPFSNCPIDKWKSHEEENQNG